MRLIFMCTPDFALPSLEMLRQSRHCLEAVVTRPDRPRGRGKKVLSPPAKEWALRHGIQVFQPGHMKDEAFVHSIKKIKPDLIVTAAYGCFLPLELLQLPPLGCINLHASLLPAYRGAAPIHRAIMDGATKTGVSIIMMSPEMDAGDIILQQSEPIYEWDTAGSLHDRLAQKGAALLVEAIERLAEGSAVLTPQDHGAATYAPPLGPEEEIIDWNRSAAELHNQVRGMNPWPGAYTTFDGKRLKLWRSRPADIKIDAPSAPGTVLEIDRDSMFIATGAGILAVQEVQPQGRRSMAAADFCRGYRIVPGAVLGQEAGDRS